MRLENNAQLNNFDLLRFLAAIAVIFSHSFVLCTGHSDPLSISSHGLFDFGGLAVATFFTISGYLIAASYVRRNEIIYFFWARILRIFPGLFVAVLFCVLIIGPLNTQLTIYNYFVDKQTLSYFLKNISLIHIHPWDFLPGTFVNNVYPNAVNGSLWTLPLECVMYILLGILGLLGVITNAKLKPLIFIMTLIGIYLLNFNHGVTIIPIHFLKDYLPSICCFMLGTIFFIYSNKIAINGKGLLLLTVLTGLMPHAYFICFFYATFSYCVLYFALNTFYMSALFKKIGDMSYGLYIYAFPIQQLLVHYFALENAYILFLITVPITGIFAYMSWHLIEKKVLKLKSKKPSFSFLLPLAGEGAEGG